MTRRVAIVTGATHGIGRATATALDRDGFRVVLAGRDQAAGAAVEAAIPGSRYVATDVSSPADVRRLVDEAAELGDGRIAGLVSNAAQLRHGPFEASSVEDWDRQLDVTRARCTSWCAPPSRR